MALKHQALSVLLLFLVVLFQLQLLRCRYPNVLDLSDIPSRGQLHVPIEDVNDTFEIFGIVKKMKNEKKMF